MKKVFLLGSTGSIGVNALDCIRYLNEEEKRFEVVGLSCNGNVELLMQQVKAHSPKMICISNEKMYEKVVTSIPKEVKVYVGEKAIEVAMDEWEFTHCLNALVGSAGIIPTHKAILKGASVLLANKETLVAAGDIIMNAVRKHKSELIPIDSEHAAIFELFKMLSKDKRELSKITLTASGGPFFFNRIENPTVEQALKHPTWTMGAKISIDSATMMNKGFEVIEAHYLFDLDYSDIDIIIHPQSIIHSMIETKEGQYYGQLGPSDMRRPIQNALTYPDIIANQLKPLKLSEMGDLTFHQPDYEYFPLLKLAFECGKRGGTYLPVLNALNEVAVGAFLRKEIDFKSLISHVVRGIEEHVSNPNPTLEEILEVDNYYKNHYKLVR